MPKPKKSQLTLKSALGGDSSAMPAKSEPVVAAADPVPVVEAPARREVVEPSPIVQHVAGGSFMVPCWILDDIHLKTIEKLVLVALCRYADDTGLVTSAPQKVIAQGCGLTEFWTRETMKELEKRGYITTTSDSTHKRRRYQIAHWPAATE